MPLSMQQVQKMSQRLIMTPQMQQSIQLLQMNSMDLEQLIHQEMNENPFLELADDEEALESSAPDTAAGDAEAPEAPVETGLSEQEAQRSAEFEADDDTGPREDLPPRSAASEFDGAPTAPEETTEQNEFETFRENDVDWDAEYSESDPTVYAATKEEADEESDFTTYTAAPESLYDSLRRQLRLSSLDGFEAEIGEFLIGNVNEDGYLDTTLENQALVLKVPVEFIHPDRAGKLEAVERRLRKALAHMSGGVDPAAFEGMKKRELATRCLAAITGESFDRAASLSREKLLRRVIAKRMKRPSNACDETPREELALETFAYRLKTTPDRVFDVLEVLQDFEPTGVCARNLSECLRLQCEERGLRSRILYKILEGHLDMLLQKKFRDIARALGCTEDEVSEVFHIISRLEPHPGRSMTRDTPRFITPDVYVKKVDGRYLYYLNEGEAGRLTVATTYKRMLKNQPTEAAKGESPSGIAMEEVAAPLSATLTPEFAHQKYKNAVWLIKNIEKRKSTILRVTEAIMEYQKAFLEKGVEHLRPLTLRDIGEIVGMHESTIARVTTNKYVETPRGIFELKYFFNSGLETDEGDMAASRAIKEMITQLIGTENQGRPLSDQKIADLLKKKGILIARRTVAKYREQLKILPARLRREVKQTIASPET